MKQEATECIVCISVGDEISLKCRHLKSFGVGEWMRKFTPAADMFRKEQLYFARNGANKGAQYLRY